MFKENSMRQVTSNRKLFDEMLSQVEHVIYHQDTNEIELKIKRKRTTLIIKDLDPEITHEQISQHLNDDHTRIDPDSTMPGVWYVQYPSEESVMKAALEKYDTQIGTGPKSYLKATVKNVTKENIKNQLLDEHHNWIDQHKTKEFPNFKQRTNNQLRPRINSQNFPTLPAATDAEQEERKFDREHTIY